jgi:hypothetical protein
MESRKRQFINNKFDIHVEIRGAARQSIAHEHRAYSFEKAG